MEKERTLKLVVKAVTLPVANFFTLTPRNQYLEEKKLW
jgi:hypothetical protein